MSEADINQALTRLREVIRAVESAVLAYSGGVDSTLVAAVTHEELGGRVLAVTIDNALYPQWQAEDASRIAADIGIRHEVIRVDALAVDGVSENTPYRCYHCKLFIFGKLRRIAEREGLAAVLDGANADDPHDHRPGLRAAEELGVISPLRETGITKAMVRNLSRRLGLPTADKPAFACLASRIPYGLRITPERLEMVRQAEDYLHSLGLMQYRVRHHDTIARIEVPPDAIAKLTEPEVREGLVSAFKRIGYTYLTLDLEGFRSGSMNAVLPDGQ